ncbi:MAG: CHASE3 domain-containing protein [Pseudomonadota bacterium]
MSLKRALLLPGVLILLLAGLTVFAGLDTLRALRQSQVDVARTRQVAAASERIASLVLELEAAQRGYLLMGDPTFLAPLRRASGELPEADAELRALVADDPGKAQLAAELGQAARERLAFAEATIADMAAGREDEARASIAGGRGRALTARVRALHGQIAAVEEATLGARQAALRDTELRNLIALLVAAAAAVAGLAWSLAALTRSYERLREAVAAQDRSEAARREADLLVRAVFENIPDYVFTFEIAPDGRYLVGDFNPALTRLLGRETGTYAGREVNEVFPRLSPRMTALFDRAIAAGGAVTTREPIEIQGLGRVVWESTAAPVFDDQGRPVRIVGSARDVTEREQAEEQLRRAQRMEAIGQLTGGVAHDFNNLLQVIRANLEMLERSLTDDRARARAANAAHAADRAADLTRQLLAFARRQALEPRVIAPGRLVEDMAELLRRTLGEGVEVETVIARGLWNTVADAAQLESAVLNLALNARDAMRNGGRLTIELSNAALDQRQAADDREVTPGDYVMVAVSDTGCGMDRETVVRIFEPFFTTKADGKGTGLGLSMVYGFVKQSKGHVRVDSEPGRGTTVSLYLPRTRRALATADPGGPVADGEGQTILVVDDDAPVRDAACAMLHELGYRCLEADGPDAALAILKGDAAVDLLFTDVVMPGAMKTLAFVSRARRLRPGLPVLYTSGYAENARVRRGRRSERAPLLPKPYASADLAAKVAAALADGR